MAAERQPRDSGWAALGRSPRSLSDSAPTASGSSARSESLSAGLLSGGPTTSAPPGRTEAASSTAGCGADPGYEMTTSTLQVLGCGAPAEAEGGRACGPRSGRAVASSEPGLAVPVRLPRPTRAAASLALGARRDVFTGPRPKPNRRAGAQNAQPGLNCRLAAAPPPPERARRVAPGEAFTCSCRAPWQPLSFFQRAPGFSASHPSFIPYVVQGDAGWGGAARMKERLFLDPSESVNMFRHQACV